MLNPKFIGLNIKCDYSFMVHPHLVFRLTTMLIPNITKVNLTLSPYMHVSTPSGRLHFKFLKYQLTINPLAPFIDN
jgi:hypothetical protein